MALLNLCMKFKKFTKFDFDHELAILYSSGTTGKPKCICHRSGGVLLQHLKEHQLHCNIKPKDNEVNDNNKLSTNILSPAADGSYLNEGFALRKK